MPKPQTDFFIPIGRTELLPELLRHAEEQGQHAAELQPVIELLQRLIHCEFRPEVEQLSEDYAYFAPDADTQRPSCEVDERTLRRQRFLVGIDRWLERANYRRVLPTELHEVLSLASPFGMQVELDLERFRDLKVYVRGSAERVRVQRRMWPLKNLRLRIEMAQRVVLVMEADSTKDDAESRRERRRRADEKTAIKPGDIHLKLFKDIPLEDLEMLFPEPKIQFKNSDRIRIGVLGGGGTIAGVVTTISKLAAALNPLAMAGAIAGFAGVLYRQVRGVVTQRNNYMMRLSKHLYFHSLASNYGVVSRLLDVAEEEEFKEAALLYVLIAATKQPLQREQLDLLVEDWLRQTFRVQANFDIESAVQRLQDVGVVHLNDQQQLLLADAQSLPAALSERIHQSLRAQVLARSKQVEVAAVLPETTEGFDDPFAVEGLDAEGAEAHPFAEFSPLFVEEVDVSAPATAVVSDVVSDIHEKPEAIVENADKAAKASRPANAPLGKGIEPPLILKTETEMKNQLDKIMAGRGRSSRNRAAQTPAPGQGVVVPIRPEPLQSVGQ